MRTKFKFYVVGAFMMGGSSILTGCSKSDYSGDAPCDSEGQKYISLTLSTPASDKVVVRGSRAADETPIHEKQEWEIKSLNLYMFKKGTGATDDTGYTLFSNESFSVKQGESVQGTNDVTDTGNGEYHFTKNITDEMIGETFKFVLIANDTPASVEDGTTLANFKKSVATAVLTSDEQSADYLVGGTGEGAKGFPMTDIAVDASVGGNEDITIGYSDVSIKASMLRNVSRIDFFNNTPNLVITGAKLLNVASHSYLFGNGGGTSYEFNPYKEVDLDYYSLNPTGEWTTKFSSGYEYQTPSVSPQSDAAIKEANTLKHVFYLYEQENNKANPIKVKIDYKLTGLAGGQELNKQLEIELKKNDNSYISPVRNYLYTIVLGDGNKVDNEISVADVVVEDWVNGGEITEEINPDEDRTVASN